VQLTFFSNTYLWDKFLGKEPMHLIKEENSNWEFESITNYFTYSYKDVVFIEFAEWVASILQSRTFLNKANEFIELKRQLLTEPVGPKRSAIVKRISKIKYD
jgi:hypothetical protein